MRLRLHGSAVVLCLSAACHAQYPEPAYVTPDPEPAYPAEFDVYEPWVSTQPPDASAPGIGAWTRRGTGDDTIVISGDRYSLYPGEEWGRDTRFICFGQTTSNDAVTADGAVQWLGAYDAGVTLPDALPDGMIMVWPAHDGGIGRPQAVNRTEAWWLGPDEATRGDTVWVYGRNLLAPGKTSAWVYVTGGATAEWLPVTPQSNPYRLEFLVPPGYPNGDYEVWAHNTAGGRYGWSGPLPLTINDGLPWTGPVFNVKDYGAVGDGVTDDTTAIEAARDAANAVDWSTLYFPAGTYPVSRMVQLGSCIRWLGDGPDATTLRAVDHFDAQFMLTVFSSQRFQIEMSQLCIDANALNKVRMDAAVWLRGGTDIRISDCRWDTRGTSPSDLHSCRRVLFRNVDSRQSSSFFFGNSQQVFFENCRLYGYGGNCNSLFGGFGGQEISVSGCTADHYGVLTGDADPDHPGEPINFYKGRFFVDQPHWSTFRKHYIANNQINNACPPLFMAHEWKARADAGASGGSGLYAWGNMGHAFGATGPRSWIGEKAYPQWLTLDLGSMQPIDRTRIAFYKYNWGRTYAYEIHASTNGSDWTEVVASNEVDKVLWNEDAFGSTTARYVRVTLLGCTPLDNGGVTEAEVYAAGSHERLTVLSATASSASANAARAIDALPAIRDWAPRARYAAGFVKTGTHYVWVRGRGSLLEGRAASAVRESDSCHIGLDGAVTATADYIHDVSDTNDPAAYVWRHLTENLDATGGPGRAVLDIGAAGVHDIDLYMYEDGFLCDKILLTVNPDYVPTGLGPEETAAGGMFTQEDTADGLLVMEAEHATAIDAGTSFVYTIDQNSGEQIMWESSGGARAAVVLAASSNTVALAGDLTDDASRMVVLVDGPGAGQSRDVTDAVVTGEGSTAQTALTVDPAWNVVPSTNSTAIAMRAARRAVVYGNLCDGTPRCWQGDAHVASAGVQTFKGGAEVVIADNTFRELRSGVSVWTGDPNSVTYMKPAASWHIEGNRFQDVRKALLLGADGTQAGVNSGLAATLPGSLQGIVCRGNTVDGVYTNAWPAVLVRWKRHEHAGYDLNAIVFEHNTFTNVAGVVDWQTESTPVAHAVGAVCFYKNTFSRGAPSSQGSYVFRAGDNMSDMSLLLRENVMSGFEASYAWAMTNAPVVTPPYRVVLADVAEAYPTNGTVRLWNSGTTSMVWTVTDQTARSWLTLDADSGHIGDQLGAAAIPFSVDTTGLATGLYEAVLVVACPTASNSPRPVSIRLQVEPDFDGDGWSDRRDADDDNDGMPDAWEIGYSLDHRDPADAASDTDDDGAEAREEYWAATDPTSSGSVLRITGTTVTGGVVMVEWQGGTLARQVLERCYGLTSNDTAWVALVTNMPPTLTRTNHADTGTTGTSAFYRVRAGRVP